MFASINLFNSKEGREREGLLVWFAGGGEGN